MKIQKNKNETKSIVKGPARQKISKRASEISDLSEAKQNYTIPSSNNLNGNKSFITE